jgi:homogentisate 1,2-dioxygenase
MPIHSSGFGPLAANRRRRLHNEVGIMADFTNPARISEYALGLSQPDYMKSWAGYTTEPRFAHRPDRLAEVRSLAEGLADARDELRPRPDTP